MRDALSISEQCISHGEWSIVLPWKGSVGSNQPWVRIPPSPQIIKVIIQALYCDYLTAK